MSTQAILNASVTTEKVEKALFQGNAEEALNILAQNYGELAKNLFKRVLDKNYLNKSQLGKLFGYISDRLGQVAAKWEKNERLNQKKQTEQKKIEKQEHEETIRKLEENAQKNQKRVEDILNLRTERRKILKQQQRMEDILNGKRDFLKMQSDIHDEKPQTAQKITNQLPLWMKMRENTK